MHVFSSKTQQEVETISPVRLLKKTTLPCKRKKEHMLVLEKEKAISGYSS